MSSRYVIALYIRLSIEDSKVESMSIENQRLALHKFADTLDIPGSEIVEFVDNGYTGTNFERPSVQELLGLVQAGQVNCIIVKDFTRFGRNSVDVGYYMEMVFPLYGVRFISLNDDFDSDRIRGETGGMSVAFKYLISEFYSRDLSMKYKSAKYVKFRRGEYQSKICPYGYQKSSDGRMEPDPETAPFVKLIFGLAGKGHNTRQIAEKMIALHVPTPGEYKMARGQGHHDVSRSSGIWQSGTVVRILNDERYTGTYIIGKRCVTQVGSRQVRLKDENEWIMIPNHHLPIVSVELYEQARANIRHCKSPKKNINLYSLRGKVFCGCCHHAMARAKRKAPYFSCRHSLTNENAPCKGLQILESELEKIVLDHIFARAQKILSATHSIGDNRLTVSAPSRAEEIQSQKLDLYEQMVSGTISGQEYVELKAQLDEALALVHQSGAMSDDFLTNENSFSKQKSSQLKLAQQAADSNELTVELVEAYVERVDVFPGGEVVVTFLSE